MQINVQTRLLSHLSADLTLELVSGRMLVLTGENGIGKSTLLQYLSGTLDRAILCEQRNP